MQYAMYVNTPMARSKERLINAFGCAEMAV